MTNEPKLTPEADPVWIAPMAATGDLVPTDAAITGTGGRQPTGVFNAGRHTGAGNYLFSVHGDTWAIEENRMRAYLNTMIVSDVPQGEIVERTGPRYTHFFDCEGIPLTLDEYAHGECSRKDAVQAALRTRKTKRAIAVLPLLGPITQRAGMFTAFFGGTSTEKWGRAFDDLIASESVGAVVIDGDSPGGSVAGVPELAEKVFRARGNKPVVFVANTWLASAAYWIASQADQIVVTPSGEVGSIGVWSMHVDISEAMKEWGEKVTLISAGKYKTEFNPYEPLSEEAAAHEQGVVDRYYGEFVAAVARGRGISAKDVRSGFGEGRMVGPKDAVSAGMADRVATLDDTIRRLGGGIAERQQARVAREAREAWLRKEEGELPSQDGEGDHVD